LAVTTHAHRIYWLNRAKITVERDVKFPACPTLQLPTHTMIQVPTGTPPGVVALLPVPVPTQAPPIPAPAPPVLALAGPLPASILLPPSPLTPLSSAPQSEDEEEEEEEEVEQELTSPDTPVKKKQSQKTAQALQPMRRSTHVKKLSQYLQRIAAGEGTEEGTEVDTVQCIFDPEFDNLIAGAILDIETNPKSYLEARSYSNWPRWKEAMDRELMTLEKAGTWITVPCLPDKNVVGSKWVYRVKHKADSSVDKYKARLVAWGLMQVVTAIIEVPHESAT